MKNLLQEGQQFTCGDFARATCDVNAEYTAPDPMKLRLDHVSCDFFYINSLPYRLDARPADRATIATIVWTVIEASFDYAGHHCVCARDANGRTIQFTQGATSVYLSNVSPEHVALVGGPPDEPGFYRVPHGDRVLHR